MSITTTDESNVMRVLELERERVPVYRIVRSGELIQEGDELLLEDCCDWHPVS